MFSNFNNKRNNSTWVFSISADYRDGQSSNAIFLVLRAAHRRLGSVMCAKVDQGRLMEEMWNNWSFCTCS